MSKASSRTPRLTGEIARFVKMLERQGGEPLYKLTVPAARQVLIDAQSGPVEKASAGIEEFTLPTGTEGEVEVRIVRPENTGKTLPALFYFHGGGWILGNRETHDRLVRELAIRAGIAVVFVNYTPSPEAHYPVPVRQAFAAVRYMAAHAADYRIDPDRIAVGGDSVGGNMAAAVTLLARREKGPSLRFQLLFYPVTDCRFDTPSYRAFADGPWLTRRAMKWFWDAYAPGKRSRREIYASPLRATLEELRGLPPALVITAENDVLRDEGEAYAARLMRAGVGVTSVRCNGAIHDFVMLDALAGSTPARAAMELACTALRAALAGK